MRPVALTTLRGGINRLKVRGNARTDMLYDLLNGYVTVDGSVSVREGTVRAETLNSSTVGLMAMNGIFHVFSNSIQSVPSGYVNDVLVDPRNGGTPTKIWFAKPFLGFPYVVAEFSSGDIIHFWLQNNGNWASKHVYFTSDIILPLTTQTGLAYQAERNMPPNPTWTAETTIAAGNLVEPTAYTGFAYRAVDVSGTAPHTGASEPVWPTTIGGIIQEFGDFDTSSTDSGTTQGTSSTASQPLGSNITDRYGNSSTIANSGSTTSGNATGPALASEKVTIWAAGTIYAPGAVTQPSTGQGAFINAIPNGDFEAGDDGSWSLSSGEVTIQNTGAYQGNEAVKFALAHDAQTCTMTGFGLVNPGQSVTASAYLDPNNTGADLSMTLNLRWYDASDSFLSQTVSAIQQGGGYRKTTVTGSAPASAKHCRVQISASTGTTPNPAFGDLVTWNLETPAAVSNFLFEAVQPAAGTSGGTEPTWPTVAGNTVIDGGVTWKAIGTSIITWQAIPIMQSGTSEPAFPTTVGLSVNDPSTYTSQDSHVTNTGMSWLAINRAVPTPDPSRAVILGASHVFNGDNDIVDYSAAVDPTDWTSANNAGYLPTGLNNYGDNPVACLALYRSNLIVFNAGGYQMWQIDPDPANMALLDAQPVGSIYPRGAQSVSNDLLFLTEVGVRNLGTVGASANMQVGSTGQPVDPIVVAQLQTRTYDPLSLYYPGRGQYWLIFGPQAFVLTINGNNQRTWSRYVFPASITDWTLNNGILYLRTDTNLVWQLDARILVDDFGGTPVAFPGVMQWPYLDNGVLGINKGLIGIDLSATGQVTVQIGYKEDDATTFSDNAGFATSLNVTAPYIPTLTDTLPGNPIPIPVQAASYSLILTFTGNQPWNWQATSFYMQDASGGGATGP